MVHERDVIDFDKTRVRKLQTFWVSIRVIAQERATTVVGFELS